jgi:hypothetical protein
MMPAILKTVCALLRSKLSPCFSWNAGVSIDRSYLHEDLLLPLPSYSKYVVRKDAVLACCQSLEHD